MAKHSTPEYFIHDMENAGWTPKLSSFEGNTGLFILKTGDLNIISWAQLWEKSKHFEQWMFEPHAKVGTDWFQRTFKAIAGYNLVKGAFHEYKDDHWEGPLNRICTDEYNSDFILKSSQQVIAWAETVNIKHAVQLAALIKGPYTSPSNPFIYIVCLAILGEKLTLKKIADEVDGKTERKISTMIKREHLDRALHCCDNPKTYKIPIDISTEMRST